MRLPSYVPPAPVPVEPSIDQLRSRLAICRADGTAMRLVNETETIGDRLELRIAEMEIAAGLRAAPSDCTTGDCGTCNACVVPA